MNKWLLLTLVNMVIYGTSAYYFGLSVLIPLVAATVVGFISGVME